MTKLSRTKSSIYNILSGILLQGLVIFLTFCTRTIFVKILGLEVLGVNAFFQNIISMLCLAELGIGAAITSGLYKPLSEHDIKAVKGLIAFYKKIYNRIIGAIIIFALIMLPFIHKMVKSSFSDFYIQIIFLLFVTHTVLTYLVLHKRELIIADQKQYKVNSILMGSKAILNILQIAFLYFTHRYASYLLIKIIVQAVENIFISKRAEQLYPYLKQNTEEISKQTYDNIITKIKAVILHFFSNFFVESTDNITAALCISITAVGKLANYQIIITALTLLLNQLSTGITASLGNLIAEHNPRKTEKIFYSALYGGGLVYSCAAAAIYAMLNPFISLWLGEKAMLSDLTVILLSLDFFLKGITSFASALRTSAGQFMTDKYINPTAAAINLILSVGLAPVWGIPGIIFGTLVYRIIEWYFALGVITANILETSFWSYAKHTGKIIFVAFISALLGKMLMRQIAFSSPAASFAVQLLIMISISAFIYLAAFWKTEAIERLKAKFIQMNKNHTGENC